MQPIEDLDPAVIPNLDELITEDGKPVDNLFVEKLYHLLTEPLVSSWRRPGGGPDRHVPVGDLVIVERADGGHHVLLGGPRPVRTRCERMFAGDRTTNECSCQGKRRTDV